jgi:hypothetical protein
MKIFLEGKTQYIKHVSRLIKNLPVLFGILVRKRVRQKLTARVQNTVTSEITSWSTWSGGSPSQTIT